MARKKVHFYLGFGKGMACPILKLAERGCFDTASTENPKEVTCWACQAYLRKRVGKK